MQELSKQTLQRLPMYLTFLKSLPEGTQNISATAIAEGLGLNDVQVRKDLAAASGGGRPKTGYVTCQLIKDISGVLASGGKAVTAIVGMGNLGRSLASYGGFAEFGLAIHAAFDADPALAGRKVGALTIQPVEELPATCRKKQVDIGIITVPPAEAQAACDALIGAGACAVWNFAPVHLTVPAGILVQNENMAASLAILSRHLDEQMQKTGVLEFDKTGA